MIEFTMVIFKLKLFLKNELFLGETNIIEGVLLVGVEVEFDDELESDEMSD